LLGLPELFVQGQFFPDDDTPIDLGRRRTHTQQESN
jgi:hypothetical protein